MSAQSAGAPHSQPARTEPMDFSALSAPVTHAEVRDFKARAKAIGGPWQDRTLSTTAMAAIGGSVLLGGFSVFWVIDAVLRITAGTAAPAPLIPLFAVAVLVLAVVAVLRASILSGGKWQRWWRLNRFAETNGLYFLPLSNFAGYPGAIFGVGDSRSAYDHFYTSEGRFADLGNYRYTTGSGRERVTRHWGFIALKLDHNLPHTVLDAKGNNGLFGAGRLPVSFDRHQVLSLEGDFDRYFTLYCPKGYERDALYVFAPDLLALLIDEGRHFDVEIVDNWMFFYSTSPFDLMDPTVLQHLFRIIDTIGAKTLRQTGRYVDERVADRDSDSVAPAGRRLRLALPTTVIVLVAAVVIIFGANAFGLLSSLL